MLTYIPSQYFVGILYFAYRGRYTYLECIIFILFFKIFYLFIFRERGREGGREGEKHQCVVASHAPPTGDLVHNTVICLDWASNQQPFGL